MVWPIIGISIAAILVAYGVLNLFLVRKIRPIFESSPLLIPLSADPDEAATEFQIPTPDGMMLSACLYSRDERESRGVIIFCHEFGGNKWSCMNYCQGLWDAGYDILAFDFRNHGQSTSMPKYRQIHWLTEYEKTDVRAVIDYVQSDPLLCERSLGLFGVSRGGSAALAVGAECPQIDLIATDSAFPIEPMIRYFFRLWFSHHVPDYLYTMAPEWHVRYTIWSVKRFTEYSRRCRFVEVIPALRSMASPKKVLLIAGARDSFVKSEILRQMQDALGDTCEEMWVVPKAKHNGARNIAPEEYDRKLIEFFSEMSPFGEETPSVPVELSADA